MLASLLTLSFAKGANGASSQVILLHINSVIDYKMADLIDDAVTDIENGNAGRLLLVIDSYDGYYAPAMQIVDRLSSIRDKVIAYVGPSGAVSSAFSVYTAMVSGLLAMNEGTAIGQAAVAADGPDSASYMTNLMRSLATMNGRNAEAAVQMVANNLVYSADEAYARGICDMKVDSYSSLLSALKIDPSNVVEKQSGPALNISQQSGYEFLKLFADSQTLKYLFIAITALVMLNLTLALLRPRRRKPDETHEALLEFIRVEMLALDLQRAARDASVNETPLHTVANMPTPPSFKMSRVPTPLPSKRLEKPLEVKKSK
jgi:membrane-bound ClpP family serine protease